MGSRGAVFGAAALDELHNGALGQRMWLRVAPPAADAPAWWLMARVLVHMIPHLDGGKRSLLPALWRGEIARRLERIPAGSDAPPLGSNDAQSDV